MNTATKQQHARQQPYGGLGTPATASAGPVRHHRLAQAGAPLSDRLCGAARLAPLGKAAMAPLARSADNKGFIGDDVVVSYLDNKGDNYETYGHGTSHCVRALQHLRICPHSSSPVERHGPSHV